MRERNLAADLLPLHDHQIGGAKCSTSRFATIFAMISSALWTPLRPE